MPLGVGPRPKWRLLPAKMLAYINRLEAPSKSPMNQASRPIYKITGPIYTPSPSS